MRSNRTNTLIGVRGGFLTAGEGTPSYDDTDYIQTSRRLIEEWWGEEFIFEGDLPRRSWNLYSKQQQRGGVVHMGENKRRIGRIIYI